MAATACNAEITFGLPLSTIAGTSVPIVATANASGAVTWNFTAPFSGSGDISFEGDNSATVNLRANSPAFDGRLYLVNAAAYHVWADGAFGSAAGATYYQVSVGTPAANMEKFLSPLWLHGITTSENLVVGGYTSHGLCFADGTTNVLNGTIDGISADVNKVTERWWVGTNACVRFNGALGCRSLAGTYLFSFIIFYGQPGSLAEINGPCNGGHLRQNMVDRITSSIRHSSIWAPGDTERSGLAARMCCMPILPDPCSFSSVRGILAESIWPDTTRRSPTSSRMCTCSTARLLIPAKWPRLRSWRQIRSTSACRWWVTWGCA